MQSGKKPVNCMPCAKRKVRCDKRQPCYHCKRRKGDVCTYPIQRTSCASTRLDDSNERLEKLEAYIRRLGGDPSLFEEAADDGIIIQQSSRGIRSRREKERPTTILSELDASHVENAEIGKTRSFVEHDETITYTELPMWYSWSNVKKSGDESQAPLLDKSHRMKSKSRLLHCFPTLLDPTNIVANKSLDAIYPSAVGLIALWKMYLKNVHPLVMIFFDWEIEPIVLRASTDPISLTDGEQALVLAILLIATMSLSEEQCLNLLHEKRSQVLARFQKAVEDSLLAADFVVTSERFVLQAFMLYLLVMHIRARPAVVFSLLGIASRVAERMGLHRDGDILGIPVLRSEERRRMWWQLQNLETAIAQLVGSVTMTIYADWDTKLPSNLNDRVFHPDMQELPLECRGLTDMSHCLWRYQILHLQRVSRAPDGSIEGLAWILSKRVSLAAKDAKIDITEQKLSEMFLQYCEPLEPLHTLIQIGVRSFILSARRTTRQPALIDAKISEMSLQERDDFLRICMKSLEYYILLHETKSLRGFQWHFEIYSQWPAFMYIILEAHHRYNDDAVEVLWSLISRVYAVHPKLNKAAAYTPDIMATVRITIAAWQKRHSYVQHMSHHSSNGSVPPTWISALCEKFDLPEVGSISAPDSMMVQEPMIDTSQLLPFDFDFDLMDWSFWEESTLDAASCDLGM